MKHVKYFFEGMLCGVLNGFFGSGGGIAAVPLLEHEMSLSEPQAENIAKRAHASSVAVISALSLTAAVSYFLAGELDFSAAFGYVPFGAAGAIVGAVFLRKIQAEKLRKLFGAIICAAAIRMLFFG